jgi:hypothetical protein
MVGSDYAGGRNGADSILGNGGVREVEMIAAN